MELIVDTLQPGDVIVREGKELKIASFHRDRDRGRCIVVYETPLGYCGFVSSADCTFVVKQAEQPLLNSKLGFRLCFAFDADESAIEEQIRAFMENIPNALWEVATDLHDTIYLAFKRCQLALSVLDGAFNSVSMRVCVGHHSAQDIDVQAVQGVPMYRCVSAEVVVQKE